MTASVGDYVLDSGLNALDLLADKIVICSAEPTTFNQANNVATVSPDIAGFKLGEKWFGSPDAAFGAPFTGSPDQNGRWVSSTAISDGSVTVSGTAAWWAVVDTANSRLLAHGALSPTAAVTAAGTFTLNSFTIHLPNQ